VVGGLEGCVCVCVLGGGGWGGVVVEGGACLVELWGEGLDELEGGEM
jgi:hypothetical protein